MKFLTILAIAIIVGSSCLHGGETPPPLADRLIARIIQREQEVTKQLEQFHPIVETYIEVQRRKNGKLVPWYDNIFVSQAQFSGSLDALRFKPHGSVLVRDVGDYLSSTSPNSLEYDPGGFVAEAYPDPSSFDLQHYRFEYLAQEFLGDVRCLVFQVKPAPPLLRKAGLLEGRIWVEDQDFTIVRFNGMYHSSQFLGYYFHFDSWRVNVKPGLWVPAAIYTSETDLPCCGFWKLNWTKIHFKAQTRFWGYDARFRQSDSELTKVVIDPSTKVEDETRRAEDLGPIQQWRAWERQAENNVAEHLESIGLLSPAGDVEKTLETVVNNIEVTNNLSFEPEVRCRVLLTSNLESAVMGHTIILSRGLIDVLPDEAALAGVLARGLADMRTSDHMGKDSRFAFADKVMFGPRDTVRKLRLVHSRTEFTQANALANEWMSKSPYKDSLKSIDGFAAELWQRSPNIYKLLNANIGDSIYDMLQVDKIRRGKISSGQPTVARALPLGSRVVIDPWSDKTSFIPVSGAAISTDELMPFEVSPFELYLRRAAPTSPATESSNAFH